MFGAFKMWGLRRKLRGSLAADPMQVGWAAWLAAAASPTHLRTSCSQPGWMVHLAYWEGQRQDTILEAALVMAQLAIDHGPPNVFPRATVMDIRQVPFPDIADLIVDIEKRYPAIRSVESALPAQSGLGLVHLETARKAAGTDHGVAENIDLAKAGVAGAAAAGFSLALQAIFHRQYGQRESMTLVTAGAASMFYIAMPDHRVDLLALLRDRFGWQHSMSAVAFTK